MCPNATCRASSSPTSSSPCTSDLDVPPGLNSPHSLGDQRAADLLGRDVDEVRILHRGRPRLPGLIRKTSKSAHPVGAPLSRSAAQSFSSTTRARSQWASVGRVAHDTASRSRVSGSRRTPLRAPWPTVARRSPAKWVRTARLTLGPLLAMRRHGALAGPCESRRVIVYRSGRALSERRICSREADLKLSSRSARGIAHRRR